MTAFSEDFEEREMRHRCQVAALNEEIDRLLAALKLEREKAKKIAFLEERVQRLTLALDEALAELRAMQDLQRQQTEAGL